MSIGKSHYTHISLKDKTIKNFLLTFDTDKNPLETLIYLFVKLKDNNYLYLFFEEFTSSFDNTNKVDFYNNLGGNTLLDDFMPLGYDGKSQLIVISSFITLHDYISKDLITIDLTKDFKEIENANILIINNSLVSSNYPFFRIDETDDKVKSYFYKISDDVLNHENYLKLKNNNYIGEFKENIHNQNINLKVLSPKDNDYLKYVKSII